MNESERKRMTRIFVGNLPHSTTDAELRSLFETYGSVSSAMIKTDPGSNRSRGFGFVNMRSFEDAEEAIARLSRMSFHGRSLTVNEARSSSGSGANRSPVANAAETRRITELFDSITND